MECYTEAEFIHRLNDYAQLEVVTRTHSVKEVFITKVGITKFNIIVMDIGNIGILERFAVILVVVVSEVNDAYTYAPIHLINNVTAKVHGIFVLMSFLLHFKFAISRCAIAIEALPLIVVAVNQIAVVRQNACPWRITVVVRIVTADL